jgi:DNA-binding CsgD family transcriptional regulator
VSTALSHLVSADLAFMQVRPAALDLRILSTNFAPEIWRVSAEWAIQDPWYVAALSLPKERGYLRLSRLDRRAPYVGHVGLLPQRYRESSFELESLVLIVIQDLDQMRVDLPRAARKLFGLTAAEARVACALVNGCTVTEIANAHQVTRATVRAQVRHILAKTGVKRQADVVRLLLHLPNLGTERVR